MIIILIFLVILIWMTISRLNLMKKLLLPSLKLLRVFSNLKFKDILNADEREVSTAQLKKTSNKNVFLDALASLDFKL